jgi:hypothetical protein
MVDELIELLFFVFLFGPFILKKMHIKVFISGGPDAATGQVQLGQS